MTCVRCGVRILPTEGTTEHVYGVTHAACPDTQPTVDKMLSDLWEAGWTTCDPRTCGPNFPWGEEQLRRQWEQMRAHTRRTS